MSAELYWLTATALMTALMWMPYVLNRIAVRGLMGALGNATPNSAPHAPWAERAMAAHRNAIENLIVFAAVVLAANAAGISNEVTATAAMLFFFARLVHFMVQTAGIPVVRTLAFAVGAFSTIAIALSVLGLI
ncbi:MAG: MAPEG family protein [Pseudomonadota bacterium]